MKKKIFTSLFMTFVFATTLNAQGGQTTLPKQKEPKLSKILCYSINYFQVIPSTPVTGKHNWAVTNGMIIGNSNQEEIYIERIDYSYPMGISYIGQNRNEEVVAYGSIVIKANSNAPDYSITPPPPPPPSWKPIDDIIAPPITIK